jgi:hypothetical protein
MGFRLFESRADFLTSEAIFPGVPHDLQKQNQYHYVSHRLYIRVKETTISFEEHEKKITK